MNRLFKIYRINEAASLRANASPDEPHHHDFQELIVGIDGALEHFIDFKTILLDASLVSFVAKGKAHRAIPKNQKWKMRYVGGSIQDRIGLSMTSSKIR